MWNVTERLWQAFHNARPFDIKCMDFPSKSEIFEATKKAIVGGL